MGISTDTYRAHRLPRPTGKCPYSLTRPTAGHCRGRTFDEYRLRVLSPHAMRFMSYHWSITLIIMVVAVLICANLAILVVRFRVSLWYQLFFTTPRALDPDTTCYTINTL